MSATDCKHGVTCSCALDQLRAELEAAGWPIPTYVARRGDRVWVRGQLRMHVVCHRNADRILVRPSAGVAAEPFWVDARDCHLTIASGA